MSSIRTNGSNNVWRISLLATALRIVKVRHKETANYKFRSILKSQKHLSQERKIRHRNPWLIDTPIKT